MSRRVNVTIGRIVVDAGTVADPAAIRAEIERQVALRLRAPGAVEGITGRNVAGVDGRTARGGMNGEAIGGAIATAIGAGKAR